MDWKEKLAKAKGLFEQARVIAEDPDATIEQKSSVTKMLEDARVFMSDSVQLKSIVEAQLEIADFIPPVVSEETKDEIVDGKTEFKSWETFLEAVYYQTSNQRKDERLTYFKDEPVEGIEKKDMSGMGGASGGFLIPDQFIPSLLAVQSETSILRSLGATVIRMTGRTASLPVLDQTGTTAGEPHWFGGMKFYWGTETERKTDTEAKIRKVILEAKKLYGLTYVGDELIEDSAISLGDFFSSPLGFAGGIAWMEDFAFLRGTGGQMPRGILGAPGTLVIGRTTAARFQYVDAINMLEAFLPSGKGAFLMSQSVLSELVQMTGPAGNASYVWHTDATQGISGYLLGMPVKFTEKLPRLGTSGDVMLLDARYYLIGDRQATTIEATKFGARWEYDETSWRAVHRTEGQPWLSAPLTFYDGQTEVSPMVVLDIGEGS